MSFTVFANDFTLKVFGEKTSNIDTTIFKRETNGSKMYYDFLKATYDYDKNRSFLKIDLENNSENKLKLFFELEVYQSFGIFLENKTYYLPTIDMKNIDQNLPYKAYIEYEVFKLGRDKINWGPGKCGNLIISDASKYFDFLGFDNKFGKFRFRYVLIGLDPYLSEAEEKNQKEKIDLNSGNKSYSERIKLVAAHRLDWEFLDNLTLSFTESSVIGGQYPDIKMINPLFFYHSTFTEGYSNVIEGIDLEYKDRNNRIYVSTAVDEWITAFDKSNEYKAPSMAFLAGFETGIDKIKVNMEYGRTSRWMYNRWQEYLKFTNRRQIVTTYGKSGRYAVDYPIGYYLGPDAEAITFGLQYEPFKITVEGINKGELTTRSDYNNSNKEENWYSLSGTVEKTVKVGLEYTFGDFILSLEDENISNFGNEKDKNQNNFIAGGSYTIKF